jgi:hypothetical protein
MRGEPDAEADSDKSPFKEDNIVQTAPFVERKNTKVMRNGTLIGSKNRESWKAERPQLLFVLLG